MKPCLVEISIFSLNTVTVRLTKIMNNLLEHLKMLIFKVISLMLKIDQIFPKKNSVKSIGLGVQLSLKHYFQKEKEHLFSVRGICNEQPFRAKLEVSVSNPPTENKCSFSFCFLRTLFSKLCPILVFSVHNFGLSGGDII